jgi:hypothetical protein
MFTQEGYLKCMDCVLLKVILHINLSKNLKHSEVLVDCCRVRTEVTPREVTPTCSRCITSQLSRSQIVLFRTLEGKSHQINKWLLEDKYFVRLDIVERSLSVHIRSYNLLHQRTFQCKMYTLYSK